MENKVYIPSDVLDEWRKALKAIKRIKNKHVNESISELYAGVNTSCESGKLSIHREMKRLLVISIPTEKTNKDGKGSFQIFTVRKPLCEVSKEDRLNAIEYISSTGKLLKMNQIILQRVFDVSQTTIANDISFLKKEARLCRDFTPVDVPPVRK